VVPKARHQTGSYRILDYIERSGSKILIPPQGAVVAAIIVPGDHAFDCMPGNFGI
jgi:hypothetical protein